MAWVKGIREKQTETAHVVRRRMGQLEGCIQNPTIQQSSNPTIVVFPSIRPFNLV